MSDVRVTHNAFRWPAMWSLCLTTLASILLFYLDHTTASTPRHLDTIFQPREDHSDGNKTGHAHLRPLEKGLNAKLGAGGIEETIGGVEETIGGVEETIGGVEETIGGAEETIGGAEETIGGVEETIGGVEETIGGEEEPSVSIEASLRLISDNTSEEIHPSPSIMFPYKSEEDVKCLVRSSCSSRDLHNNSDVANILPCMCDDVCYLYGDCCHDHVSATLQPPPVRPACRLLTPMAARPYTSPRTVFLVDRCPGGTELHLSDKCLGDAPPSYLLDLPVFSNTSGIGYSNIFCALCHNDADILELEMSISCIGNITSTTELENMTYHSGELRWTSNMEASGDTKLSCLLNVVYPPSVGRWCQSELIDTCREDWPVEEQVRRCAAYNYYVQRGSYIYRNRDCALCNGVPQGEIKCLSLFSLLKNWYGPPPSLMELFRVRGECEDDEVWDVLYRRCEHVSCGLLFTLQDGVCVRSYKPPPQDDQSYLNVSCYVSMHRLNERFIFPNRTIHLEETQRLYYHGEYELDGSWVRVCDDKKRWTPIMHILSAGLILISLVCLILHMAIFIVLPERRNIPSKNLFSMTISLFMAEFMYVAFFEFNGNRTFCVIVGMLIYYFLGVSFLWMNVMSVDIFRTFYSNTYRMTSGTIFFQYSLYAWLLPVVSLVVAQVVDQFWPDLIIAPHIGTDLCWFNNKWGLVLFFTFPSGMIILINMIFYVLSVYTIYKQMKVSELASSTVRKNDDSNKHMNSSTKKYNIVEPSNVKKVSVAASEKSINGANVSSYKERIRDRLPRGFLKKHQERLILYFKLALMMGLTWIFAFISIHTNNVVFEYLFIIFNGLQGTFIFVSFDLKKKIWQDILYKIQCRGRNSEGKYRMQYPVKSFSLRTASENDGKAKDFWRQPQNIQGFKDFISITKTQPSREAQESEV